VDVPPRRTSCSNQSWRKCSARSRRPRCSTAAVCRSGCSAARLLDARGEGASGRGDRCLVAGGAGNPFPAAGSMSGSAVALLVRARSSGRSRRRRCLRSRRSGAGPRGARGLHRPGRPRWPDHELARPMGRDSSQGSPRAFPSMPVPPVQDRTEGGQARTVAGDADLVVAAPAGPAERGGPKPQLKALTCGFSGPPGICPVVVRAGVAAVTAGLRRQTVR
jgi:hypothetical protein